MKYGLFVGEMLADSLRTRRATWKDLHADSHHELLITLREAMGEPVPELSQKYVVLWEDLTAAVGKSTILTEFARAFERSRIESPFVRSFEERGFQVDWIFQQKSHFVCIAAHHGAGQIAGLADLLSRQGSLLGGQVFFMDACSRAFMAATRGLSATEAASNSTEIETEPVRIGFAAYLRSMWTLFWTAFGHPSTTTVIDLSTGKRIAELSAPFCQWEASVKGNGSEPVNG
jgi:hypothetical protein